MNRIQKEAATDIHALGIKVVDINAESLAESDLQDELISDKLSVLAEGQFAVPSNTIRAGDNLNITIYEVGYSLFGSAMSIDPQVDETTARDHRIGVPVDDEGNISLPYVGTVHVEGLVPEQVQRAINARMRGLSQSPQSHVSITESVANSAYISGAVAKPGRLRLTAVHERLLDFIALAGGPSIEPDDVEVRLVRKDQAASTRLGVLRADDSNNIVLFPGDRIELIKRPRTYSVLGASDRVSQVPFGTGNVSLAEAIARAGGASDARADPRGIFIFRLVEVEKGTLKPLVYRINMLKTEGFFFAQRFTMRNGDVLYFSNSPTNLPTKLINVINQLTSPIVTARILTR
jgi:polysaccharide biosynthesis/export protein